MAGFLLRCRQPLNRHLPGRYSDIHQMLVGNRANQPGPRPGVDHKDNDISRSGIGLSQRDFRRIDYVP